MHALVRIEYGTWTYTFPEDSQRRLTPSGFRDAQAQTVRLPGMDGAIDQYGLGRAAGNVGDLQVEFWFTPEEAQGLQTYLDDSGQMADDGVGKLVIQPIYGPERFAWARINAMNWNENVSDMPHKRVRVTMNFQVADGHFYSDSGFWPGLIDGTAALNGGLTFAENAYSFDVDGATVDSQDLADPDLDTGTGWTKIETGFGTATFAAGTCTLDTTGGAGEAAITQEALTLNQLYRVTVVVNSISGTLVLRLGDGGTELEITTTGTHILSDVAYDATFYLGINGANWNAVIESVNAEAITWGHEETITNAGNATALPVLSVIPGVGESCEDVRVQRIVKGVVVDEARYTPVLSAGDEFLVDGARQIIHVNGLRTFKPNSNWKHPDFLRLAPGANLIRVRFKFGNWSDAATVRLWWLNTWR